MRVEWQYAMEYSSRRPGEYLVDILSKMGANGWEAWHMEPIETGHRVYFKRPKAE